jgi:hypothetical protein
MLRASPPTVPFLIEGGPDPLHGGFAWLEKFAKSRRQHDATVLVGRHVELSRVAAAVGFEGETFVKDHSASVNGITTRLIVQDGAVTAPEGDGPILAVLSDTELGALPDLTSRGLCVVPPNEHTVEVWKKTCRPDDGRAYDRWSRYVHNIWARAAREAVTQVAKEERTDNLPPRADLRGRLESRRFATLHQVERPARDLEQWFSKTDRWLLRVFASVALLLLVVAIVLFAEGHLSHALTWLGYSASVALGTIIGRFLSGRATPYRLRSVLPPDHRELYVMTELSELLVAELLNYINDVLPPPFLAVESSRALGLSERADPSLRVATTTATTARQVLSSMRGGSIGLAGPRGAGKTVLLRALSTGRFATEGRLAIGTVVNAPVRYEAAEFVSYTFSALCLAVLAGADPADRDRYKAASAVRALLGLTCAYGLVVAARAVTGHSLPLPPAQVVALFLGALALAIAYGSIVYAAGRLTERKKNLNYLRRRARKHLHELRYLDTISHELLTEVAPWSISKLSIRHGISSARQAPALPELVRRYRQFVEELTYPGPQRRRKSFDRRVVVVGIDELDKMTADDARRFLNDVKTLFGQRDCYYVVSVSEDAMTAFEQRGAPIRDEFDSSFDAVVGVEPLRLEESRRVLQRRVLGLGLGSHMLAHATSGGLPRELIRVARDIVNAAGVAQEATQHPRLGDILWPLAVTRLRRAEDAAMAVARRFVTADGTQPLLEWLRSLPSLDPDPCEENVEDLFARVAIKPLLRELERRDDDIEVSQVALQLAVLGYHTATTLQYFRRLDNKAAFDALQDYLVDLERADTMLARKRVVSMKGKAQAGQLYGHVELLARARRDMSLAPTVAWSSISELRADAALARA